MRSLAIDRSDAKGRGGAGLPLGCGLSRAPMDHYQFKPERLPSLPAGGRSLRAGCAVHRRQSGARAGVHASRFVPPIRPTRLAIGVHFDSLADYCNFLTARKAGLSAQQALALLNSTDGPSRQALSAQSMLVHVTASRSAVADEATKAREASHGAGEISQGLGNV